MTFLFFISTLNQNQDNSPATSRLSSLFSRLIFNTADREPTVLLDRIDYRQLVAAIQFNAERQGVPAGSEIRFRRGPHVRAAAMVRKPGL